MTTAATLAAREETAAALDEIMEAVDAGVEVGTLVASTFGITRQGCPGRDRVGQYR